MKNFLWFFSAFTFVILCSVPFAHSTEMITEVFYNEEMKPPVKFGVLIEDNETGKTYLKATDFNEDLLSGLGYWKLNKITSQKLETPVPLHSDEGKKILQPPHIIFQ